MRDPDVEGRVQSGVVSRTRVIGFLVIALVYAAFPNARPDLTPFNADDSEAYLALSYAITHGLGYTRSLAPGLHLPHTTWPPGMPVLLAPVMAFGALPVPWLLVKASMIGLGLLGIVLAWLYVRQVTRSPAAADGAALLLALMPFYWLASRQAMTQMPTVVFVLAALLLLDRVWASRCPAMWQAVAAGAFAGLGMLLRGTLVGLLLVPLGYALGPQRSMGAPRRLLARCLLHAAAFCVPSVAWGLRNRSIDRAGLGFDGINQVTMLVAKNSVEQDSPLMSPVELLFNSLDQIRYHIIYNIPDQLLPGLWVAGWRDWPGAPYLAVALTLGVAVLAWPRRMSMAPLLLVLGPYVGLMLIYTWGGSVRYWVPITGLLGVLIVVGLAPGWAALSAVRRRVVLGVLAVAYGVNLGVFVLRFEARPYLAGMEEMVTLFEQARPLDPAAASVRTEHSVLFTLMTGIPAPMTVAARGLEPRYTHAVVNERSGADPVGRAQPVVPGATELSAVGAWRLYALPRPMTEAEMVGGAASAAVPR